jgi:hypothetical protein
MKENDAKIMSLILLVSIEKVRNFFLTAVMHCKRFGKGDVNS